MIHRYRFWERRDQHFHPIAFCISSSDTSDAYPFFLETVIEYAKSEFGTDVQDSEVGNNDYMLVSCE